MHEHLPALRDHCRLPIALIPHQLEWCKMFTLRARELLAATLYRLGSQLPECLDHVMKMSSEDKQALVDAILKVWEL